MTIKEIVEKHIDYPAFNAFAINYNAIAQEICELFKDMIEIQNPYPADVFIEPSDEAYKKLHSILQSLGSTLDAFSGSISRGAWEAFTNTIKERLEEFKIDNGVGK